MQASGNVSGNVSGNLSGNLLIGSRSVRGTSGSIQAIDPKSGATLEPAFGGANKENLEQACALAWQAFDSYRETSLEARAKVTGT